MRIENAFQVFSRENPVFFIPFYFQGQKDDDALKKKGPRQPKYLSKFF